MKKKNRKGMGIKPEKCPYCGSPVVLRSADGIYKDNKNNTKLYVCSRYPACDAYVRTHFGTDLPVGSMADHRLRTLRRQAHQHFDQLYKSGLGLMSKQEAYHLLASIIQAPLSHAHIGYLGEYYCNVVIEAASKLLENHRRCG